MANTDENVSNNQTSTWYEYWKYFTKIHFVKCDRILTGIIISIVGLLISLWSNCIVLIPCIEEYNLTHAEKFIDGKIIHTSELTHFIISVTCSAGLIYGIRIKNTSFFTPWLFVKIMEIIVLGLSTVFLLINQPQKYIGMVPLGISFMITGMYVSISVWKTYSVDLYFADSDNSDTFMNTNLNVRYFDLPPRYNTYVTSPIQR